MVDTDATYARILEREVDDELRRLEKPLVRIWDGDWNLIGEVHGESKGKFTFKNNETGIGTLDIPMDNWVAQWIADHQERTSAVHVTMDKSGARWSGRMEFFKYTRKIRKRPTLTVQFKHDYEELKHILVWSNPFLPAEVQFPKAWTLFGPARWALMLTLFVNIQRREGSLWMLPDDPGDPSKWFNLDQSTWWNVVKPYPFLGDGSMPTTVISRFSNFHSVAKKALADGQLTVECRRYLKDEDDPPWEGADLRNGCLVWDIVDKSGWTTGTAFGGNLLTGLIHSIVHIGDDGMDQTVNEIEDPNFPDEYYQPGFMGTLPEAPWVVFRDGPNTGVKTQEFTVYPATDVQVVAGGHSMPGVNEGLKFAISTFVGFLGSFIGQSGLGPAVADLTESLYTDVFMAFVAHKDVGRAQKLGGNHYFEHMAEGADRAYTIAALIALRAGMWSTRERIGHKFEVVDGANGYWIGDKGHGDFFVGDRVGVASDDFTGHRIYVEQVQELSYEWGPAQPPKWKPTVGYVEPEDPTVKLWDEFQNFLEMFQAQGVL